jgi:hypothetical protein
MRVSRIATTAAALLVSAFAASQSAMAQAKIEIGQLACASKGGIGLLIMSKKSFACTFKPTGGRPPQHYTGSVTNLGIDVGVTGKTVLVWTVLASGDAVRPDILDGYYTGVGADASVAVGLGANVLLGGSKKSIALQPLSAQAQTGLNLAVGVKGFRLKAR